MAQVDVSLVFGKIQFVNAFADYKAQVVAAAEDLRVERVTAFARMPGQWEIVDAFPDYKIELVDAFPDFTIRWVDSFPGPSR